MSIFSAFLSKEDEVRFGNLSISSEANFSFSFFQFWLGFFSGCFHAGHESGLFFPGEIRTSPVFKKKVDELDGKCPGATKSPDPDATEINGNIS